MASLAASRAAASLGVSEMLGNPLNFSGATRSASPTASTPATFKTVALFSKKKPAPKPKPSAVSPADVELAKWYGKWSIFPSILSSSTWWGWVLYASNKCYSFGGFRSWQKNLLAGWALGPVWDPRILEWRSPWRVRSLFLLFILTGSWLLLH